MNKPIEKQIAELVDTFTDIQNRAVETYTPIVDEICSRKASEDEVDTLLSWMFDFLGNEKMLLLFKKLCRTYLCTYPEVIGFYIMEYRKIYDPESLEGIEYEINNE